METSSYAVKSCNEKWESRGSDYDVQMVTVIELAGQSQKSFSIVVYTIVEKAE